MGLHYYKTKAPDNKISRNVDCNETSAGICEYAFTWSGCRNLFYVITTYIIL
jgi:hypothetical protein